MNHMAVNLENIDELYNFRNPKWKTSITKVEPNRIITRGYPQEDLIGKLSFPEMVYLLINGNKPSENESKMLEAILVSFCDHGITPPSTQAARLMASSGSSLRSSVAGGLLAFGGHHAGALEKAMKFLQEQIRASDGKLSEIPDKLIYEILNKGVKIPGFGHRYHSEDPRAPRLIEIAKKYGFFGLHTELVSKIEKVLIERKGIKMNIDGANAGILSDMGFDWRIGTGIFMIGRLPGIIAHVKEEINNELPFRKIIELNEIFDEGVNQRKD